MKIVDYIGSLLRRAKRRRLLVSEAKRMEQAIEAIDAGLGFDELTTLGLSDMAMNLVRDGVVFYDRQNERFWRQKRR